MAKQGRLGAAWPGRARHGTARRGKARIEARRGAARRGKGGRRGGDYQIWHARVEGYDGPAHVMRPRHRNHGRRVLEVWAPVKLKDELGLEEGSRVKLRVGA